MIDCPDCQTELIDAYGGRTAACAGCGWEPPKTPSTKSCPAADAKTLDGACDTGPSVEFRCPVCPDEMLRVATIVKTQVCICRRCRGFLVDSVSLAGLIAAQRREYRGADDQPVPMDAEALQQELECPTCLETMHTHPYHGPGNMVINSCGTCQLNWLDEGELIGIIRAPGRR